MPMPMVIEYCGGDLIEPGDFYRGLRSVLCTLIVGQRNSLGLCINRTLSSTNRLNAFSKLVLHPMAVVGYQFRRYGTVAD